MSDSVDYYDVQNMIRDAVIALRAEMNDAIRELREDIGSERVDRQDAIESLQRALDARTEHLA